ncbi:disease resistance protein TAO1 [Capsella rubella]|uniref:disease resistance protein TAO1 n=1 Tax=Capsella rubella TaxID=81985 RepID=UPI000CD58825|nr:disease resistance protein TAO1 [Capsella rubella]
MVMDSSFFLATVTATAIGFFTLFRKFKIHQEKKDAGSSSTSPPSASSSSTSPLPVLSSSTSPPSALSSSTSHPSALSSSTSPSSSLSCNWTHHVFASFRGEDIRRNFLSHIQKEFKRKGITHFIDNGIRRGESIGPELIKAIRGSKIAVVLLSRNYASSKWCLDELVEIMECKQKYGLTVFVIFYEVDPSHVKKLTGEFGDVFEKTCKGRTKEDIRRWREAFKEVATIAGYDSRKWETEAAMIEEIVIEIFKRLFSYTPSSDLNGLIGMGAHMENMKQLLCLGSTDEKRVVGISGPSGIGKSTIARVLYNQISNHFELNVFMKFEPSYPSPISSDDHDVKLQLEQQFLSQLTNQKDIKIHHLGTAENFVMGKKVLIVLDGVDQLVQLLAMPKAVCLGPGSCIIITTQNQKLLEAFKINSIYNVNLPPHVEALQIFCMNAFDQDSPYDGFERLAWEVTGLAGRLPLGLRVMGSHFRGMSKKEWKAELPRLRVRLDGKIHSTLKFSYDALNEEDKDLFLHIACFFNETKEGIDHTFEDTLRHNFSNVHQGLQVLIQRSLISKKTHQPMQTLLVQLGREIVRNKSIYKPGKRRFLVDADEICEVFTDHTGSKSVIGINLNFSVEVADKLILSERAFEEMPNLELFRFGTGVDGILHLPQGLNYLPPKLRILDWDYSPMTCFPSKFNPKFLVKIILRNSKLGKLWEGIQPLINLKVLSLGCSRNLKKLPNLSRATNLLTLNLASCSSLIELPSSIGNATNIQGLGLSGCSSLIELPSSIGNATNIQSLDLSGCSSLVKLPSSIGNITNLQKLNLCGCSSLVELPSSIGNLINLLELDISICSSLLEFPSSFGNIVNLSKLDISECSSLLKLPSSIGNIINLHDLEIYECSSLVELSSSIGNITNLQGLSLRGCSSLVQLPSSIGNLVNLQYLNLKECSSLVELPSSIGNIVNLQYLDLNGCSSLVELPSSIGNIVNFYINLTGCSSLVEIPAFISTIMKNQKLYLCGCSSIVELPSSIGNMVNLQTLDLGECFSIVQLPSSIGNIINLRKLNLRKCSSLLELPSSIGNIVNLRKLILSECSSLVELPSSIGDIVNLEKLDLRGCSSLVDLPSSIGNIVNLQNLYLSGSSSLVELPSSIGNITSLQELELSDCLVEIPCFIGNLRMLKKLSLRGCSKVEVLPINIILDSLEELDVTGCSQFTYVPAWINGMSHLRRLVLKKCMKLVSLPQLPCSLSILDAENCESLETLTCSFPNPEVCLRFIDCWKLKENGRDIIIQTSTSQFAIFPCREMPAFFTYRATTGSSLVVKFNPRRIPIHLRFKACLLLINKGDKSDYKEVLPIRVNIVDIQRGSGYHLVGQHLSPLLTEHLYTFEVEVRNVDHQFRYDFRSVECMEILFKFEVDNDRWKIRECGIRPLLEEDTYVERSIE